MSTLAEYFAEHRPKAKYQIGDRVEGVLKKIPWVGTVGSDIMRNEDEGSMVSVHLDLPFKIDGIIHQYIRVKYKDLKLRT
jgi:hypothetical protein